MSDISPRREKLAQPNEVSGTASIGWWGTVLLIANETMMFIVLFSAYFYLRVNAIQWILADTATPDVIFPLIATILLFLSSVFAQISLQTLKNAVQGRSTLFLLSSLGFGSLFLVFQIYAGFNLSYFPPENAHTAMFLLITGIHLLHVLIGLFALSFVSIWIALRSVTSKRFGYLQNVILYWHFAFVMWLIVFAILYMSISF